MKIKRIFLAAMLALCGSAAEAQTQWPVEQLKRNVIAVPNRNAFSTGCLVSWRMMSTDDEKTTFDVYRDNQLIASNLATTTNYYDWSGKASSVYKVVTKQNGVATGEQSTGTTWQQCYMPVQLDRPAGGTTKSGEYTYRPNDCSVGDVDGDGEYEIVVKWDPTNSTDNGQGSFTGNTILDCYKFNGTKLWRINLGPNIRSGAHYMTFLVYDFDRDGKAELICRTSAGSVDGKGNYVSAAGTDAVIRNATDNGVDYRDGKGIVASGPEYLTVFNGQTGAAVHTIWFNPNRAGGTGEVGAARTDGYWGKSGEYYNRVDRFLGCVAYLAGANENPSAVMCRGYYARAFVWAVDYKDGRLSQRWLHHSASASEYYLTTGTGSPAKKNGKTVTRKDSSSKGTLFGNGNHNLSVADVDGDGKDEILYGAGALDDNGDLLYSTGYGHGDAIHVGDLVPDRPGLEVFDIHEASPYGFDLHDARTGEILYSETAGGDTGRGIAADVDLGSRGSEYWASSSAKLYGYDSGMKTVNENHGMSSPNFRIYWDGDLAEEHLGNASAEQPFLQKYGVGRLWHNGGKTQLYSLAGDYTVKSCNYTKSTPCLQADIFGDWREELVFWHSDCDKLIVVSTSDASEYRVPCLMFDHTYRMGVAWQNCAYNQPPHLGFYLPDYFTASIAISNRSAAKGEQGKELSEKINGTFQNAAGVQISAATLDGNVVNAADEGFVLTADAEKKTWSLGGAPKHSGTYELTISTTANARSVKVSVSVIKTTLVTSDEIVVNWKAQNRIANNGDGTFTTAVNAGNQYALAIADLSDVSYTDAEGNEYSIKDADEVAITYTSIVPSGSRWNIGLGDKDIRGTTAANSNKGTYDTNGLIMRHGTGDGSTYRVNGGTNNANAFGKTLTTTITFNKAAGIYSYTIQDDENTYFSGTSVSTTVSQSTILEAYSWQGSSTVTLGDAKVKIKVWVPSQTTLAKLNELLESAMALFDVQGDLKGEIPFRVNKEASSVFNAAIMSAKAVALNEASSYDDYDNAFASLTSAIEVFRTGERNPIDESKYYSVYLAGTDLNLNLSDGSSNRITVTKEPYMVRFAKNGNNGYKIYDTDGNWLNGDNYNLWTAKTDAANSAYYATLQADGTVAFPCVNKSYNGWGWKLGVNTTPADGTVVHHRYYAASSSWMFSAPYTESVISVKAAAHYGTFYAEYDCAKPAGVTAYTCEGVDGHTLLLEEDESEVLSAYTPYILYIEAANDVTSAVYGLPKEGGQQVGSVLVGVTAETEAPVGSYVLQSHASEVAFYRVGNDVRPKVGANRCYLNIAAEGGAAPLAYYFDGGDGSETTVGAVESQPAFVVVQSIHSVDGHRLTSLQKGINIVRMSDGSIRKVLMK